jgi:predicted metalloprotease with PDZ domain
LAALGKFSLSAGDLLIAINHLRVTSGNLDVLLASQPTNGRIEVMAFRRDELMQFNVHLQQSIATTCGLRLKTECDGGNTAQGCWLLV